MQPKVLWIDGPTSTTHINFSSIERSTAAAQVAAQGRYAQSAHPIARQAIMPSDARPLQHLPLNLIN